MLRPCGQSGPQTAGHWAPHPAFPVSQQLATLGFCTIPTQPPPSHLLHPLTCTPASPVPGPSWPLTPEQPLPPGPAPRRPQGNVCCNWNVCLWPGAWQLLSSHQELGFLSDSTRGCPGVGWMPTEPCVCTAQEARTPPSPHTCLVSRGPAPPLPPLGLCCSHGCVSTARKADGHQPVYMAHTVSAWVPKGSATGESWGRGKAVATLPWGSTHLQPESCAGVPHQHPWKNQKKQTALGPAGEGAVRDHPSDSSSSTLDQHRLPAAAPREGGPSAWPRSPSCGGRAQLRLPESQRASPAATEPVTWPRGSSSKVQSWAGPQALALLAPGPACPSPEGRRSQPGARGLA